MAHRTQWSAAEPRRPGARHAAVGSLRWSLIAAAAVTSPDLGCAVADAPRGERLVVELLAMALAR